MIDPDLLLTEEDMYSVKKQNKREFEETWNDLVNATWDNYRFSSKGENKKSKQAVNRWQLLELK